MPPLGGIVNTLTIFNTLTHLFLQWRPRLPLPSLSIPVLGMIDLDKKVTHILKGVVAVIVVSDHWLRKHNRTKSRVGHFVPEVVLLCLRAQVIYMKAI